MNVPLSTASQIIEEKGIYYFAQNVTIGRFDHMHICIKNKKGKHVYLSCCTSQVEKRLNFIRSRNLPISTLIEIRPDEKNAFRKNTYIDGNFIYTCSEEEFIENYKKGRIKYIGEISDEHYNLIVKGILDSTMIAEEDKKDISE